MAVGTGVSRRAAAFGGRMARSSRSRRRPRRNLELAVEASAPPSAKESAAGPAAAAKARVAKGHGYWSLVLGSLGVVFGDIGTSPLYAMREALAHSRPVGSPQDAVLGVVSLVIWALTAIVTIKYVIFL